MDNLSFVKVSCTGFVILKMLELKIVGPVLKFAIFGIIIPNVAGDEGIILPNMKNSMAN